MATFAGGCGRIGFNADKDDDDAGIVDATRVIDASTDARGEVTCGAFGAFQRLDSTVAPNFGDFGGFISDDGLTLVFSSERAGGRVLFQSTRSSVVDDFLPPTPLVLPGGNDDDPWLSADRLTVFFNRGAVLMRSVRANTSDLFDDIQPVGAEFGNLVAVDFSEDLLTCVGSRGADISIGRRTSAALPFTQFSLQPEINENNACCGTLSPDNTQLIYSVNQSTLNIAVWDGATFTDSTPFAPLNATQLLDAHWSKSGRFMVLSAIVAPSTDFNLFLATADCS